MPKLVVDDVTGHSTLKVNIDGKEYLFHLNDEKPNIHEAKFCAEHFANRVYCEVMKFLGHQSDKVNINRQVIKNLSINGLETDGEHHKQWYLESILEKLGYDVEKVLDEELDKGYGWERGVPS